MRLHWTSDFATWDTLVRQCPDATFFHRAPWLAAVSQTLGARFCGAIAEWPDGAVGLIPLVRRDRLGGLLRTAYSGGIPGFGGYGGLVSPAPLTRAQVEAAFHALARTHGAITLVGTPYAPGPRLPDAHSFQARTEPIRVVPMSLTTAAPALPDGLERLSIAYPREFHADMYGRLEPAAAARPRAFYYHLFRTAEPGALSLHLLQQNGQTIAGALVGRQGATAHLLGVQAAGDDDALKTALLTQLPGWLGAGLALLDLGQVSEGTLPHGWRTSQPQTPVRQRPVFPSGWLAGPLHAR